MLNEKTKTTEEIIISLKNHRVKSSSRTDHLCQQLSLCAQKISARTQMIEEIFETFDGESYENRERKEKYYLEVSLNSIDITLLIGTIGQILTEFTKSNIINSETLDKVINELRTHNAK